jgi:hypothetical protein
MRGFFRRLSHRDAVRRNLEALLLLYPRRRRLERDFPALKATIRADFEARVEPGLTALRLAAAMLASFFGQLTEKERSRVLAALAARGRDAFAIIVREEIRGRRDRTKDRVEFLTRLSGAAIYIAGRMAEEGALRFDDYADFVHRIEKALGAAPGRGGLTEAFSP